MDVYEKNIESLEKHFPGVASWIKSAEIDERFELINAFSGQPNLSYLIDRRKKVVFYDMDNPEKQIEEKIKDCHFYEEDMTILVGFGLGYLARAIAEKMEEGHLILVLEKHPEIIKLALSIFDFSDLIETEALIFCLPEEDAIYNVLEILEVKFLSGDPEIELDAYTEKIEDEYIPLVESANKVISRIRVNLCTVTGVGKIFAQNEIMNLAYLIRSAGVSKLKNAFQGIPAIIVSRGPSLQKNIHLLKKAKGRAVIIAVGQALRVLVAYDINPDIVVTLDWDVANKLIFEGLFNLKHIPLVVLQRTYPESIKHYQGDLFAVSQARLPGPRGSFFEKRGFLRSGASVAHLCFSLAEAIGAEPIIFTGQDLAYSDRTHIEGTDLASKVIVSGNEMFCLDSEDNITSKKQVTWIEGYGGGKAYADTVFLSFLQIFERWIGETERPVINATEGGARIRGTVEMPLSEVLEKYCQKEYNITKIIKDCHQVDEEDLGPILKELEDDLYRLREISKSSQEGLKATRLIKKEMKKNSVGNSSRLQVLKRKNYAATMRAQSLSSEMPLIQTAIAKEVTLLGRRDFKITPETSDASELLEKGVKRNVMILTGVLNAARDLRKTMNNAYNLLKNYHKAINLSRKHPNRKGVYHKLGLALEDLGYLKEATDEYRKEIEVVGRDKKALHQLAKVYAKREKYKEAEEVFRELEELDPHDDEVKDELENVVQATNRLLESVQEYHKNGDFTNTIIQARKVLYIKPNSKKAKYLLDEATKIRDAKTRQATGEEKTTTEETKEERFQKLIENSRVKLRARDFEGAAEELRGAEKLFPDREEVRWGFSTLYFIQGDFLSAEKEYNYLIDKFPDKADYHFELGKVLLRLGKIQQAVKEIKFAIRRDQKFTSFLPQLGRIFIKSKDYQKAIKCYEDYIRINPASYEAFTQLGDCYCLMGAKEAAIYGYRSALEIKPDYQVALERLKIVQPSKRVLH